MCGFAGFLHRDRQQPVDRHLLAQMGHAIVHRGPDATGYWVGAGIGFVHLRLSIIDLAGGAQPMGNEDGRVQVVFNGEIYNYQELRTWLEGRGHRFATNSDTEVLVHGYEELGPTFINQLQGMFAFAIWDDREQRLMLGRDRLGIKPLYFYRDRSHVRFASQPKALLTDAVIPRQVCAKALEDYLCFGMVLAPRSIFEGIEQLPPAHYVILDRYHQDAKPQRYWSPQHEPIELSVDEWTHRVYEKVYQSVKSHLLADVPVGAFLSGGVDSSAVVSMMSKLGQKEFHTFSIGFDDPRFSELPYAREVAKRYGTKHIEHTINPDAASLVDELSNYFDEPFADTSALPTFLVSQLASKHVKVVLSGDGADEAFAGYERYAHDLNECRLRDRIPPSTRFAIRMIGRMWPRIDWLPRPLRLKNFLLNLSASEEAAYANSLSQCRLPLRRQLLSADVNRLLGKYDPKERIRQAYKLANHTDSLAGMLAADQTCLLPDGYLVKVDRASMANGLEVRPPFLDHELMELANQIPSRLKVGPGGTGKWIMKRAFARDIPAENMNRPKRGFNVPIDEWMRGPLQQMFMDEVFSKSGPIRHLIQTSTIHRLMKQHQSRRNNHGQVLWSLLVLSHWAGRYLKPPTEHSQHPSRIVDLTSTASRMPSQTTILPSPTPPIRVGFAIHVMQVAGAEVLIEETIKRLGTAIEPTILCLDAIGKIGERLQKQGVPVICLNRKTGRDWALTRRMAKEIQARRIQVVHAHQYTPFFYSALAKLWCLGSFKLIQTEHGRHYPDIVHPQRRMINRLVLDKIADESNACCAFSAIALSRNDGFVGRKIGVIENGVELSRYTPNQDPIQAKNRIGLEPHRRHIGCVARFHPVKDHAMLLRAFARLASTHPDVDLVFAGEGQLRPNLEHQAAEAGILDRVKFLGVRTDVPDVLAAMDIFALTSVSEAASLTLMEAMATAKPSVVTNVGGNPELIRDGIDGILVPRGDDMACALALKQLLTNQTLAKQMGEQARLRAEAKYNLDATVNAYYQLYAKLTRGQR